MVVDWQGLSVVVSAVGGLAAALMGGYFTGTNARRKDREDSEIRMVDAESKRKLAEETASTQRIEDIAADAAAARRRARDLEDEFDARLRVLRKSDQMGWDLAKYHFGLVSVLAHLINNATTLVTVSETPDPDRVISVLRNTQKRMESIVVPRTLEEPMIGREPPGALPVPLPSPPPAT